MPVTKVGLLGCHVLGAALQQAGKHAHYINHILVQGRHNCHVLGAALQQASQHAHHINNILVHRKSQLFCFYFYLYHCCGSGYKLDPNSEYGSRSAQVKVRKIRGKSCKVEDNNFFRCHYFCFVLLKDLF